MQCTGRRRVPLKHNPFITILIARLKSENVHYTVNSQWTNSSWPHELKGICHDNIIKWKYFPRYWSFVRRIHRSPVNSPHKCQWRGALMFSLNCAWTNGWANHRDASDLRCRRVHYVRTVMVESILATPWRGVSQPDFVKSRKVI